MPHSGSLNLTKGPMEFGVEDVPHIIDLLTSVRRCPIVWITREKPHLWRLLNPDWLFSKTAGAAFILVSRDDEAESALRQALPPGVRASDGSIRIYEPSVELEKEWDSIRHRHYTKFKLEHLRPEDREREIVRGVIQRMDLGRHDAIFSVEDVQAKHRHNRLRQLRDVYSLGPDSELIQLLETENKHLEERIEELQQEILRQKSIDNWLKSRW
ncbi:MAG TPA: hypothetical protein VG944_20830 [Fimbriimonas sp.]|nr:hypothetical protein [Fimbriimonas sp.]